MTFKQKALNLLLQNKRETDGHIYTVPSPSSYPYQWFWDSCFHAIILSHINVDWAKEELLSLVSKQFENGLIPHMIYWIPTEKLKIKWGKADTSTITQPPIIADAVLKIYQTDSDIKFLKIIYPSLKKYYFYLLSQRDTRKNHIVSIINPDESGEDNSPRFDLQLQLLPVHKINQNFKQRLKLVQENLECDFDAPRCMKNFFWTKDVPFNAILVKNLKSMSKLAQALNLLEDTEYFENLVKLVSEAMRKFMFEDGMYFSLYEESYQKIKVRTWAIFTPLYAKLYTYDEALVLVNNHLLKKSEFWPSFPVPTVAMDEPSFDPKGFWRGPTWISVNWFIFQGLLNYGFFDIAEEILRVSKKLVETQGFREQFNPKTGKGQGAKNFTWGGLILDMEKSLLKR